MSKPPVWKLSLLCGGLAAAGIWRSFSEFRRGFVPVLAYHAMTNDPEERHEMKVQQTQFERQMRWLKRHGYETAPSAALIAEAAKGRKLVGITFDDGFSSVHRLGLPVIQELRLGCAIFVSTDYVGHDVCFPWEYAQDDPPLSWQEVNALREGGFEVGSHACSHRRLSGLDDAELERELGESRRRIHEATGADPKTLAYPHGDFDERVKQGAARAGYATAFAVYQQPETADALSVPRILVRNQTSMLGFRLRMWGLHPFLKSRRAFSLLRPWLVRRRWAFL